MTTLINHKRVEFSELFYDLVFVFAISKVTTLIDHLHNGILTWNSFLDFFMARECRSVHEIYVGQLKPYGVLVEGKPMHEPKQPLPNDVYLVYLDRLEHRQVKASALSNQRTAYLSFLREQLC